MNIFKKHPADEAIEKIMKEEDPAGEPAEEWVWVDGYKGTDSNMRCQGYQYEIGKTYVMPQADVELCKSGFHLCLSLNDVFDYYGIEIGNRFFRVKALVRKSEKERYSSYGSWLVNSNYNNKLAAASIIFVNELSVDEILQGTDISDYPTEYKQLAINVGIQNAMNKYKLDMLLADGYSFEFANYLITYGMFDVAHAIGTCNDVSMDMKVLFIMNGMVKE